MHSDRIAVLAASRRSFRRSLLPGVDRERVAHSGAAIAVAVTNTLQFQSKRVGACYSGCKSKRHPS